MMRNQMVTRSSGGFFHGLADPTRWRIVQRLSAGGLSVGEIAADFPMSRPAVSKHLRVLRMAGLVVERKEGRRRIYELVAEPLEEIALRLERLAAGTGTQRGRTASSRLSDADDRAGVARGPSELEPSEADLGPSDEREWRSW